MLTTYNIDEAIIEYEDQDEARREVYLYSVVGYALYISQTFEKLLMNIIWAEKLANRTTETNEDLNWFFDKYEKGRATLGPLKQTITKILNLSTEESTKLDWVVNSRNYIIHKYFVKQEQLHNTKNGYKIILRDFIQYINTLNEVEEKLNSLLFLHCEKIGLSKDFIQEEINKQTAKWQNEMVEENYASFPA